MGLNLAANVKLGLVEFNMTFVFQIINTLILYFILKHLLFEPVTKFMNQREEEIANDIDSAEQKKEEANALKDKYQDKLNNIDQERRQIIKEAKQAADRKASDIVQTAKEDAKDVRLKNQKELEREKTKAINELKDEISNLALLSASKVVEKNLKPEEHKELIDNFINEVGDVKWQN